MKQSLQLRTSQHLALTPQLQQSIRLLQLSTLDLNQELEQILQDNPLLERLNDPIDSAIRLLPDGAYTQQSEQSSYLKDGVSPSDGNGSDEPLNLEANHIEHHSNYQDDQDNQSEESSIWGEASRNHANQDGDDEGQPQLETINPSLREYLLDQVNLSTRTERDAALISLLIEALDENGYLDESLDQIHAGLPNELGVEQDDLIFALNFLQSLEPAGVGARNVSECLTLQIKRLPHIPLVTRRLALTLVQNHLSEIAGHDFAKIKRAIDCDDQELREVQEVIQQCQPHPGRFFSKERIDYIAPDVFVIKSKEGWHAQLNQDVMPKLQINSLYANLLMQHNAQHKSAASLQSQLQEARWLIKNIRQRYETILRVSQAIVDRQRNFFVHGAIAMRPLVLREIADTLELHESTISRVTTQKYMLTPHGIVELKYFFGSHIATEAGGEASSTAIRALIKQLIGDENQTKPLSDSKIANILGEQGMVVARRTVAKYREALKIPSVNLRKIL
jgi:RNA polymerase sigma-54 factor